MISTQVTPLSNEYCHFNTEPTIPVTDTEPLLPEHTVFDEAAADPAFVVGLTVSDEDPLKPWLHPVVVLVILVYVNVVVPAARVVGEVDTDTVLGPVPDTVLVPAIPDTV